MYLNNSNECGHCGIKFKTISLLREHLDTYAGHCAKAKVYNHFDEHPEEESEYQPTYEEILWAGVN